MAVSKLLYARIRRGRICQSVLAFRKMAAETINDHDCPLAKRQKSVDTIDNSECTRLIDVRSDTVTKPTKEMREAMARAEVGDDVYGEDPTVNKLQREIADLLGKEDALYVPTGTMGNLIAVMVHCKRRGDEILLGDQSHISLYEQGGVAQIAGVFPRLIRNLPDGTLDLQELERKLNKIDDPHLTFSRVICVENTQNQTGGCVIRPQYMDKIAAIAKKYDLKVHIDGARILNAAVALGVHPSVLTRHADSVSMCMSKGLGAPVGSVLAGSKEFIKTAVHVRKSLGGGMRQAGIIAAGALYALQDYEKRLKNDHANAQRLAAGLRSLKSLGITVEPDRIDSNMIFFTLDRDDMTAFELGEKMEKPMEIFGKSVSVKMLVEDPKLMRVVTHLWVTQEDVDCVIEKLKRVLSKE